MADTHFLFSGDIKDVHTEEMTHLSWLHARGWKTTVWKLHCGCPSDAACGLAEYLWAPPKGAQTPGGRAVWHCQGTAAGGTWTPWAPAAGTQRAEVPWGIGSPAPPGSFLREEKQWKSLLWVPVFNVATASRKPVCPTLPFFWCLRF